LRPSDHGTVANFLIARYPEMRAVGDSPGDAGLVHRLDNETSGVLLAARTAEAHRFLRRQFREQRTTKEYLALVVGNLGESGRVDTPIAHQPRRPRRMCVCPDKAQALAYGARPAVTRYRPIEKFGSATLVEVGIETGVRHQIRVHLASIGHPVLGDPTYGGHPTPQEPTAPRTMLHACRLRFRHPLTGRLLTVDAPLPADFRAVFEGLRNASRREQGR
jgi:23S rRNA pseudouridine1911/1915/1917 synthase